MTATIPGEQLTFEATDATEFRALLGRILEASPLSCSQIAIKTGMPRSTAYSLPNTKRPGLPSNPRQVSEFVRACGLTATQTALVMDLWGKLRQEAENARTASEDTESGPALAARFLENATVVKDLRTLQVGAVPWMTAEQSCQHDGDPEALPLSWATIRGRRAFSQRETSWTELLQYVLAHEDRTRRAVSLLRIVALLVLVIVGALVFLALRQPAVAPVAAAVLAGPALLLTRRSAARRTRKTKN